MLRVVINGRPRDALVTFRRLPDGRLAATPRELMQAGFKPGIGKAADGAFVPLDRLAGITWRYDETAQTVEFNAPDAALTPNVIDLRAGLPSIDPAQVRSDYGALVNYTLYGASQAEWSSWNLRGSTNTFNGSFNARVFTPFGTVSTTALVLSNRWDGSPAAEFARLETSWRYVDPVRMLTYQVGDGISGGLPWASSYRFGGLQLSRNFATRPDLLTSPTPSFSGSASLPSSLDLYINNIQVFAGQVPAGPFAVTGLPVLSGAGDVRVVMKDELGREVVSKRSYYVAPDMLRQGLLGFSTEVGFPRLGYGNQSGLYDPTLAGSASARYGLADWLTIEGHGETTRGLFNGGAGAITSLGPLGSVRVSGAASHYTASGPVEAGGKASVYYQIARNGYALNLGIDKMLGAYNDIGLAVDRRYNNTVPISARAREILRGGIALPLYFDSSSISFDATRIRGNDSNDDSTILSVSWSRSIRNMSVYASAYTGTGTIGNSATGRRRSTGVFTGLSIPLGDSLTLSSGVASSRDGASISSSLSKSARLADGEIGWSVRDQSVVSGSGNSARGANVTYRSSVGALTGTVEQSGASSRVSGAIDGAVVLAGGDIFFGNRIEDAFAVVKAGGPNLPVSLNSTVVTETNRNGRALIPYLQSYRANRVSIDPQNLPFDLQPQQTEEVIVPAERSGVVVDFGIRQVNGASVMFTTADGAPVPVGSEIRIGGRDQVAVAGYDGRSYLTGLAAQNSVTITMPDGKGVCQASFEYQPVRGEQPDIGSVICKSRAVAEDMQSPIATISPPAPRLRTSDASQSKFSDWILRRWFGLQGGANP